MGKVLLGALCGLLAGALLGSLLAIAVHPREPDEEVGNGWTSYPKLSEPAPLLWQHVVKGRGPPLSYLVFQGVLIGGGFGSLVGAVAAATGAIIRAGGHPNSRTPSNTEDPHGPR